MPTPAKRLWRLLTAHPFDILVPLAMFLSGLRASFFPSETLSGTIDRQVPTALVIGWQLGVILGSALALAGILGSTMTSPIRFGAIARWRIAGQVGCIFASVSFLVYALVLLFGTGSKSAPLIGSVSLALALAFALTAYSLRRDNRDTLDGLNAFVGDSK